MINVMQRI